jgi:hypothetical protein
MRNSSFRLAALAALALSACPSPQASPPPLPPLIKTFSADKTQVTAGTAVKLSFTADRATEVTLLDDTGASISLSGDASAGDATVTPTRTSFYVLRASGEGGRDSAFVQVAVGEVLHSLFLVAVPAEVTSGDTVTLAWSAAGGSNITLKDASGATLSMAESGTLEVKPVRSTQFDLKATGVDGPLLASAQVKVHPVITSFTATPPAAKQGDTLSFSWKTAGADSVKLSEATFGDLVAVTSQASVDEGSFDFTVPATFDGDAGVPPPDGGPSRAVPDNFPLRFTLTAQTVTPAQSVTAQLPSFVRAGPNITRFDAPAYVTEGKSAKLSWTVTNGYRAELLLDGAPVFATVPPGGASGSFTLPSVSADVTVTLVAYDFNALPVRQSKTVKVAKAPKVNSFTLSPTVATGGAAATAMWTASNATLLLLRVKDSAAEFETTVPAMLNAGMTAVHPGRSATYVLEAYNQAGDKDTLEKSVTVAAPLTASATANPTAPSSLVMLTWDVTAANPADVVGIPAEPPVSTPTSTTFLDIHGVPAAAMLSFANSNDAAASFSVGYGFGFPAAGQFVSSFSPSTNGFLSLGVSSYSSGTNVDLKGASSPPPNGVVAPLWDDLDLGSDGAVEWLLDGSTFPRRVVVQWTHAHFAGEPTSDLTFEVQLYETGEVRFEYSALQANGTRAAGDHATVGIFLGSTVFAGQYAYHLPLLTQGQGLDWFVQGLSSGARNVLVGTQNIDPGFFYKTPQGTYVWVDLPVRVFNPSSVVVNEVMATPATGATQGQYVELLNASGADVDLGGLQVSTASTPAATFTIPPGTRAPKFGYVVLGQTTATATNGGAPVDVGYGSALTIQAADAVSVAVLGSLLPDAGPSSGPFVLSSYAWGASTAGTASQREPAVGGGIPACTLTQTFGSLGSLGTPGAQNESCFPYTLSPIAASFEDVSQLPDAGPLLSNLSWFDLRATVTLPVQFPYFGVDAGTLVVSANGWLSTRASEIATGSTNKTAPGSTTPIGAIAPFWDDLQYNTDAGAATSNIFSSRQGGNHQVVQWHRAAFTASGNTTAELDFEAKLFDNGVIEFHYGPMVDGYTTPGLAQGSSATVWIEAPDGGAALPVSINQAVISPNTAYRFTPKP